MRPKRKWSGCKELFIEKGRKEKPMLTGNVSKCFAEKSEIIELEGHRKKVK